MSTRALAAWHLRPGAAVLATIAGLCLAGQQAAADSPAAAKAESQAAIKRLDSGLSEITLRPKAASRIDIHLSEVADDPTGRKVTPFSSIIYDLDGYCWVYKATGDLTFVREHVVVESVSLDAVYLKDGPPSGTKVVTVGVVELYGTEFGVNGE
jgi:hypothetical protein